MMDYEDKVAQQ
jgi:hypothetical protein